VLGEIVADGTRAAAPLLLDPRIHKEGTCREEQTGHNGVIQEVLTLAEPRALMRIEFCSNANWMESLPPVLADRVQMQQVLLNLDYEWHRSPDPGDRSTAVTLGAIAGSTSPGRTGLRYAIPVPDLARSTSPFHSLLLRRKRMVWEWVCPSAAPSLKIMAVASGLRPTSPMALLCYFTLPDPRESFMTGAPVVFVVDDDPSVRSSSKFLLRTVDLAG